MNARAQSEPSERSATGRWGFLRRLAFRKAVLLAATSMPLGLILIFQIDALGQEAARRQEAALSGATLLAGGRILSTIEEARGATVALAAAVPGTLSAAHRATGTGPNDGAADDGAAEGACDMLLRRFVDTWRGGIGFASFVRNDGEMVCASNGARVRLAITGVWTDLVADPRSVVTVNPASVGSGLPVLVTSEPVRDRDGTHIGFVSVSVPQSSLTEGIADDAARPVALVTYDRDGNALTGLDHVPFGMPASFALSSLALDEPRNFRDRSNAGAPRLYAVVPLVDGELFLLGSWPVEGPNAAGAVNFVSPIAFAVLMWAATVAASVIGSEHLVNRHIRALRAHMRGFASGQRGHAPPMVRGAPQELRDVAAAYANLTDTILHEEAALEDTIRQKEILLREVHHRVKNNLQLIASIMNMQIRQTGSAETREVLKSVQDRVMSLATIHKELYQTSGLTVVRADELLRQIAGQVLRMSSGSRLQLALDDRLDPVTLMPDQAVPLALLLTETLNNAVKYAARDADGVARLRLDLTQTGMGSARFALCNRFDPAAAPVQQPGMEPTGLGSLLLTAFAQQLGGQIDIDTRGNTYSVALDFPITASAADDPESATDQPAPAQV